MNATEVDTLAGCYFRYVSKDLIITGHGYSYIIPTMLKLIIRWTKREVHNYFVQIFARGGYSTYTIRTVLSILIFEYFRNIKIYIIEYFSFCL